MVNKVFKEHIGRTTEVYIDHMLVKSFQCVDHVQHLSEAFDQHWKYKVRLNPKKCTFRVAYEKFLGFLNTQRDIEANPDQISTILHMKSPIWIKEVQMLNGRLTNLSWFLSWSMNKHKLFFQAIKKNAVNFHWDEECEEAPRPKEVFRLSPSLIQTHHWKILYLYLAV